MHVGNISTVEEYFEIGAEGEEEKALDTRHTNWLRKFDNLFNNGKLHNLTTILGGSVGIYGLLKYLETGAPSKLIDGAICVFAGVAADQLSKKLKK